MEELSAEKFRKFTDVLFDVLGKSDVDVNRLIEAKEAVLRNTEEYKGRSEKELRAIAYSEAVAEMMEPVLTDTDAISRISQKIKQQDRSLWEKIKDFIKGIVEKLKAAYRDMEPDSAIARLTRETVTNSEAVLDAFSEAAADAVVNYNLQEGQKNNAREGVQFSTRENKNEVAQMREVSSVSAYDGSLKATDIVNKVSEFFESIGGSVNNKELGTISLRRRGIKNDVSHGIGREKAASFMAVPDILQKGKVVDYQTNWKGRGYDTAVIAAPIKIAGVDYLAGVCVKRTSTDSNFYVHEVLPIKNEGTMPFNRAALESVDSGGDAPSINSILLDILAVKGNFLKSSRDSDGNALTEAQQRYFADSQVRDEDGNLIPVYHRTDGDFTVFLRGKLGGATLSNAADAGLAATSLVGHWFSDHDLGDLIGKNVVKSYLNIQNPYETDLLSLAQEISGFSSNPEMMQEHFENGQYNMVRKAAAEFTAWLRSEGYDGLKVTDQENGGVSYVVLDSRQAKLTTNQNPTGARDLRYSSRTASDSEYLNLAQNPEENREALSRMVENAAKEAGYTRLFFHGSKKGGGFTVFRDWQYFTENREYAKRYANRENPGSLYETYVKMENPFDTRIPEVRELFEQARQEYGMGELQENGLPDWTDGYDIADYIDENDLPYDGIILDEGGDMVNGKPVSRGLSYVIRDSSQVKSADAVTYDDNGNVIPLSQRFDMGKEDIRYSARNPQDQAEAENERLKSDVQSQIAEAVREYRRQQDVQSKAYRQMYERQMEEVKKSYQKQISTMESEYSADLAQIQDAFFQTVEAYEKGQFRNEHLEKALKQAMEAQRTQTKASEADNATWEKEFNRLLKAYEASGRNAQRLKQTVEAQRARAKAKVEAARVTEQRGKLYRAVNEINRRLLNPTKTLYVPDSLAPAVTKFMQGLTEAMESPKNSWNVQGALETLQGQYQKLTQMNEGVFTQEYNQGILDLLDNAINAVGGTDFNKLSASQIEDVYSAVRSVLTAIRNENKMFAANLNKTYAEAAAAVRREESGLPNRKPTTGAVQDKAEKFGWNQLKPVYAMMRLGSDTLLKQYNNLRAGEDKWQRVIAAARAYGLGTMAKYNYDQWDDSLMKLDTETGTVELSLQERMSLYAYARREQAFEHLTKGGFVLSDKNTRTVKNRFGIKTEQT